MSNTRSQRRKRTRVSDKNGFDATAGMNEPNLNSVITNGTNKLEMVLCRACLSMDNKPLPPSLLTFYESIIEESCTVELPMALCVNCAYMMRKFYKFQEQCKRVHGLLCVLVMDEQSFADISPSMKEELQLSSPLSKSHTCLVQTDRGNIAADGLVDTNADILDTNECCIIKEEVRDIKIFDIKSETVKENIVTTENLDVDNGGSDFDWTDDTNADILDTNECSIIKDEVCDIKIFDVKFESVNDNIVRTENLFKHNGGSDFDGTDDEPLHKISSAKPKKKREIKEKFLKITLSSQEQRDLWKQREKIRNYQKSKYKCDLCYKGFDVETSYNQHLILHTEKSGELICDICSRRYARKKLMRKHRDTHQYMYQCLMCNFRTQHKEVVTNHIEKHQGKIFNCKHCGKIYNHRTTYLNHLRARHAKLGRSFQICGLTFMGPYGIEVHMKKAHKDEQIPADGPRCAECNNIQFLNDTALNNHMQITHDLRNINRLSELRRAKSVYCELCHKHYPTQTSYHRHFAESHPTVVPKTVRREKALCDECGKTFQCRALLLAHQKSHTSAKGVECDECGKVFTYRTTLSYHKAHRHRGVSYNCNLCDKKFSHPSNRARHVKYYHKDIKDERCGYCEKSFKSQGCLKNHIDHVHKQKPWKRRHRGKNVKTAVE